MKTTFRFIIYVIQTCFIIAANANQTCVYKDYNAYCQNLQCYNNISRNIRSLKLNNSCNFNIDVWDSFNKHFPELENLKFTPFCKECLKIDSNFQNLNVEGRCLENSTEKSIELDKIIHEIAVCLAFLIFLTILYFIRFIKHELSQYFSVSTA